ncbi:GOLD domain-containing protein [Aix galericulata]|nr:GOLD domain-containing protein [Aix galericulata]
MVTVMAISWQPGPAGGEVPAGRGRQGRGKMELRGLGGETTKSWAGLGRRSDTGKALGVCEFRLCALGVCLRVLFYFITTPRADPSRAEEPPPQPPPTASREARPRPAARARFERQRLPRRDAGGGGGHVGRSGAEAGPVAARAAAMPLPPPGRPRHSAGPAAGAVPLPLPRPRLAPLLLLLLLLAGPARPISFQLPGKARKCLREEIHRDTLVTGEYEIGAPPGSSSGPSANLKVTAPAPGPAPGPALPLLGPARTWRGAGPGRGWGAAGPGPVWGQGDGDGPGLYREGLLGNGVTAQPGTWRPCGSWSWSGLA